MNKITIYHDDHQMDVVDKINKQLEKFGLTIEDVSQEGADFMEYQIKPLSHNY